MFKKAKRTDGPTIERDGPPVDKSGCNLGCIKIYYFTLTLICTNLH